jgi:hypothetical protein
MSDQAQASFDWSLWVQWVMATSLGWIVGAALGELSTGVALGGLQWLVLRPHIRSAGWWGLVTAAGWAVAWLPATAVLPPDLGILSGALIGAALGTLQWLILRDQVHQAAWWILVSTLAWTIGLSGLMGTLMVGVVAGAVTGIALELLLRYPCIRK